MQDFAILDGFRNRLLFRLNSMFFIILYDKGSPRRETLLFKSDHMKRSGMFRRIREPSGTRTPDNLIKSQVLYHLS